MSAVNWLPVESLSVMLPGSVDDSRRYLQQIFQVDTGDTHRVRLQGRGWRGVWFYAAAELQTVNPADTRLRLTIRPNLWLTGTLLLLLPLLKIVIVMSNPAQLWPLSLAFWPLLLAGAYGVLRQKQTFKTQLLALPQHIQQTIRPGHAVQTTAPMTPSATEPLASARSSPGA